MLLKLDYMGYLLLDRSMKYIPLTRGHFAKIDDDDFKWVSQIRKDNKIKHIGTYDTMEEAARAYDSEAIRLHGEFAYINFGIAP